MSIPETVDIRRAWVYANSQDAAASRAEFDAWLKEVAAEVWEEAMDTVQDPYYRTVNPYA